MFDGKIDFMDFNKIKINYGGKLTCRKIFKRKYLIFLAISIIGLIFLISLYTIKNRKIKGFSMEIKQIESKNEELDEKSNLLKTKNIQEEMRLSQSQTQVRITENSIDILKKTEQNTQQKNLELIAEKEKLEKQSASLNNQLKKEKELKEVYEQKISSLKTLLESLKTEYEKLLEQKDDKKDEDNSLNIENSKIINQIEAYGIERSIKGTLGKKCFDGTEDNFNPTVFHKKCDGNAILVLIKTDNNERIGAFSKVSFEGSEVKNDPSSALFNIDKGTTFPLGNSEYSTIVCEPNELPQFGVDLQIKTNGQGINSFPFNYGNKNKNFGEELTQNHIFQIENLEIYIVQI